MNVASQIVLKRAVLIKALLVNTPGIGSQYQFEYPDFLRRAQVYGIETIDTGVLTNVPTGEIVIPGDYTRIVITLMRQVDNALIVNELPYLRFNPQVYSGYTQYIKPTKINWEQSFVKYVAAPAVSVAGMVVPLIVYYQLDEEQES